MVFAPWQVVHQEYFDRRAAAHSQQARGSRRPDQRRGILCGDGASRRQPCGRQRRDRWCFCHAGAFDIRNGGAWPHRMRRRSRHWRAWRMSIFRIMHAATASRSSPMSEGQRAGIYTFTAGRLTSIERGPEPVAQAEDRKTEGGKEEGGGNLNVASASVSGRCFSQVDRASQKLRSW